MPLILYLRSHSCQQATRSPWLQSRPIEVRFVAEQASKATVEVNVRPLSSLPGTESKALATSLKGLLSPSIILSRNSRTPIQLVIQSLTPSPAEGFSPSLIDACINASSLALLNAGSIPMTSVVCAVAIARLRSATEEDDASALVLDPTEAELLEAASCGCFAFSFATEISGGQQSQDSPAGRMVWTNWHAKATACLMKGSSQVRRHLAWPVQRSCGSLSS